jgi:hypothetical protein
MGSVVCEVGGQGWHQERWLNLWCVTICVQLKACERCQGADGIWKLLWAVGKGSQT